ncbi:uncharacterized protein METZ01_LOCUS273560 [marine metagenome]|uniref:Uncharacterized protein n=1 Tax=marine metagenome TaxID=408172 RepID=A0A382K9N6_9ZZZZ
MGFGNFKILYAENHDTTKESTETTSETETEEDVPLNDPFAGNAGLSETLDLDNTTNKTETRSILYDYKLVGVISGSLQSYVSLVDAGGQVITLEMFEELSVGLQLVDMNHREAVFQRSDGKYLIINFKNQIVEREDHAKK